MGGDRGKQDPDGAGSTCPACPASRANVLPRDTVRFPDTRESALSKLHRKAAGAMKRSNSYLHVFINRDGGGLLSPDAFPLYQLGAAGESCAGITGAHGLMASPEQLRTPAELGCGLYLLWEEVSSQVFRPFS